MLRSSGDTERKLNLPSTNQETIKKFLPPDVRLLHLRTHPNGHDRIGILFVTDRPLNSIRRFFIDRFEQCRIDIDVDPNLCISIFDETNLPAVMATGHDEPTNKEFIRIFVSEEDWNEAIQTGADVIGVLAVEPFLLPDGIIPQDSSS